MQRGRLGSDPLGFECFWTGALLDASCGLDPDSFDWACPQPAASNATAATT